MRFDVITIFPEVFDSPLRVSLVGKAIEAGLFAVGVHDLRDWASGVHRKVDDIPFGGGAGMVMSPGPIIDAVESIRAPGARILLLAASGEQFDQTIARELASTEQVVLVCGRYEGIDDRVREILDAQEVSVGPFVLAGGEVAALAIIEATARLIPGVLGNASSVDVESFSEDLLEFPQYTRPPEFRSLQVPQVLLSGDHGKIARWRREQALRRTFERRPELLEGAELTEDERRMIEQWRSASD